MKQACKWDQYASGPYAAYNSPVPGMSLQPLDIGSIEVSSVYQDRRDLYDRNEPPLRDNPPPKSYASLRASPPEHIELIAKLRQSASAAYPQASRDVEMGSYARPIPRSVLSSSGSRPSSERTTALEELMRPLGTHF